MKRPDITYYDESPLSWITDIEIYMDYLKLERMDLAKLNNKLSAETKLLQAEIVNLKEESRYLAGEIEWEPTDAHDSPKYSDKPNQR